MAFCGNDLIIDLRLKTQEVIPEKPKSIMVLNIVDDNNEIEEDIFIDVNIDEDEPIIDFPIYIEPEELIDEILPEYAVEIKPKFPGGEAALLQFVASNYKIPREDIEQGNQGMIYVEFIVEKDGQVSNPSIKRGISHTANQEAIRVVQLLPDWTPGQQSIKKVAVKMVLPIKVKLM